VGYAYALGIAESGLELATQLHWHFTTNCYPPVPLEMVPVAEAAINLTNRGEADEMVAMPDGVEHRKYGTQVPAWVIVNSLHLGAFIESLED